MNWPVRRGINSATLIDWATVHVHDTTQHAATNWDRDWLAGCGHFLTTGHAVSGVHRDATNGVFTQVLSDFEDNLLIASHCLQSVQDCWQLAVERYVDNSTQYL